MLEDSARKSRSEMKRHFVPMKLQEGMDLIPLIVGQTVMVHSEGDTEDMVVPMTILKIYDNGDFDGEVVWEEA